MTTWTSAPAVTVRDTLTLLAGKLAPGAALRGLTPIYDWHAPRPGHRRRQLTLT